jgi:hypothetical protein
MAALDGESGRTKVPIDRVAATAYRIVFGRLGRVLELAWLPLLVLLAVELLPGLLGDYLWPDAPAASSFLAADIAEKVIVVLCLSAFAVRWHHLVLAADRPLPLRRFLVVWARFLGYSLPFLLAIAAVAKGTSIALNAVSALPPDHAVAKLIAMVTPNVASAFITGVALALVLVLARCSLLFPSVVMGQALGILSAWRRMRGNTWRFVAATLLVTAPILLLTAVLLNLILAGASLSLPEVRDNPPLGLFLLNGVFVICLFFLSVALVSTVLADFYRRLVLHLR